MKKILLAFTVIAFATLPIIAQIQDTNTPPTASLDKNFLQLLTTGSNYWVAPYATMNPNDRSFGGGLAIGYHASDWLNPVARLDYYSGNLYAVAMTAQLSPPRTWLGKFPAVPWVAAGISTTFSGLADLNGSAIPVLSTGAAIRLDWLGLPQVDVLGFYEKRLNIPQKYADNIGLGVLIKFGKW